MGRRPRPFVFPTHCVTRVTRCVYSASSRPRCPALAGSPWSACPSSTCRSSPTWLTFRTSISRAQSGPLSPQQWPRLTSCMSSCRRYWGLVPNTWRSMPVFPSPRVSTSSLRTSPTMCTWPTLDALPTAFIACCGWRSTTMCPTYMPPVNSSPSSCADTVTTSTFTSSRMGCRQSFGPARHERRGLWTALALPPS